VQLVNDHILHHRALHRDGQPVHMQTSVHTPAPCLNLDVLGVQYTKNVLTVQALRELFDLEVEGLSRKSFSQARGDGVEESFENPLGSLEVRLF
jgi:hypothetical protein